MLRRLLDGDDLHCISVTVLLFDGDGFLVRLLHQLSDEVLDELSIDLIDRQLTESGLMWSLKLRS